MGFPQSILDVRVELLLASAWTDVSSFVYQRDRMVITRGHPDESTITNPSTLPFTLDNRDGRFSSRNPTGPYYGQLSRNTQVRVSVPEGGIGPGTWQVAFHGDGVTGYPGAWSPVITGVVPGGGYQAAAWLMSPQGWAAAEINLLWYTAGGVFISTSAGTTATLVAGVPLLLGSGVLTAPPAAAGVVVAVQANGTPASNVVVQVAAAPPSGLLTDRPIVWGSGNNATVTTLAPWRFTPATASYLRLEGDTSSYAQTPSAAPLNVAGDLDVQLELTLHSWRPSDNAWGWSQPWLIALAGKYVASTNQRSWELLLDEHGYLVLYWSTTGANVFGVKSPVPVPVPQLRRQAVRVTLARASGTVTFWTAPTINGTWTQVGSPVVTAATSVFASTAPVQAGYLTDGAQSSNTDTPAPAPGVAGKIHALRLLDGIGGTVKVSPDFTTQLAGAASFSDAQGNTWSLFGTCSISDRKYRFHGEVAAWPQSWDPPGKDVFVQANAGGLLRRLGRGAVHSAMWRGLMVLNGFQLPQEIPVAYWPCEDGSGAKSIASALPGVPAMSVSGAPGMAADSGFVCSEPIPLLSNSTWVGAVPGYVTNGVNHGMFLMSVPAGGMPNGAVVVRMFTRGTVAWCDVVYGTGGTLTVNAYSSSGALLATTGAGSYALNGVRSMLSLEITTVSVGNLSVAVQQAPVGGGFTSFPSANFAGTAGAVTKVVVNPNGTINDTALGHVCVIDDDGTSFTVPYSYTRPLGGWVGEPAGQRFWRLCFEEGIPFRSRGDLIDTVLMGAQTPLSVTDLLQECASTDLGMLYEPREHLALGYRTRVSLQSQTPAVTLDYTQAPLTALQSADDDQTIVNDLTLTRSYGGSSVRVVQSSGSLSTLAPPAGVGVYAKSDSVNCWLDSGLPDVAGWKVHLGTVDQPRYPELDLNLGRPELTGWFYQVQDMDVGDRLMVVLTPPWLPPDGFSQLLNQLKETLFGYVFEIGATCVPETPYQVALADDTAVGRADTSGSTLLTSVNSTATRVDVATPTGGLGYPMWSTAAADFPFDIVMGGERITVTNIDGNPINQLTGQSASFDGGLGTWVAGLNASVAASTVCHAGSGSLAVTSLAAGTMTTPSCLAANILTQGLGCSQTDLVAAAAWVLAAATGRTVNLQIAFYDAGGVLLSTASGATSTDSTTAWTKLTMQAVAPTNTARARLIVQVAGPAAAGETHYVDDAYLADLNGTGRQQTFTVTRAINGVVKAHAAGEDVRLFYPPVLSV